MWDRSTLRFVDASGTERFLGLVGSLDCLALIRDGASRCHAGVARHALTDLMQRDRLTAREAFVELLGRATGRGELPFRGTTDHALLCAVLELLNDTLASRLILLQRPARPVRRQAWDPDAREPDRPEGPHPPCPAERTDWIEVAVVGEDGSPIGPTAYELVLPDGTKRRGRTGEQGVLRLQGIPPGECQLTLPELDGRAWEMD